MKITLKTLVALAGAAAGSVAIAQPFVVNISGATLQENFFRAPASTIDFLDLNNSGTIRDQLAPFDVTIPFLPQQFFQIQYRAVGSVNGLVELDTWGTAYALTNTDITAAFASRAYNNRTRYINNGVTEGPAVATNPGAAPVRSTTDGTYTATTSQTGGIQIDIAPLDVPVLWGVTAGTVDDADPLRNPTSAGYGTNDRLATLPDGTPTTQGNTLATLIVGNLNVLSPDAFTIFDTSVAITPVAPITNYGTGLQQVTLTDLQHTYVTGRRKNGENLVVVTRDSGSGTRNAFNNGILIDPSWGIGDNIGVRNTSLNNQILGPNFLPSNKGGQGQMEGTLFNHRLAVGYSGPERGVNSGWLGVQADFLAVLDDVRGGTIYARPTIDNLLDNTVDGFNIQGPAVFATFGDPRAEPASNGGDDNGNPRLRNTAAALYINNITRSVESFKDVPGGDESLFTPAEFLALDFLLPTAVDFVPSLLDPEILLPNPNLNQLLQDFTRNNAVTSGAAYENFNTNVNGRVPTRQTGTVYTDGVANGGNYITQAGTALTYGQPLNTRNKISGDFDGNGVRDLADVPGMIAAWNDRNGGSAWLPGSDVSIEIIGDFTGDGNFDSADVRYFADGLALVGGRGNGDGSLDRFAGFEAVDDAFGGNFFGTTLATGAAYTNGASAGDIFGDGSLKTPGYNLIGFDGVVDAYDIDYVCANFGVWENLSDAATMDLSADMNGDLVVDAADVAVIVETFLGTQIGDVNLDGVVDGTDESIAMSNLGMEGGWAMGDVNCDGMVTQADIDIITGGVECPGDTNGDNLVNFTDLNTVLSEFGQSGMGLPGDVDGNGVVNFADLNLILSNFGAQCN
jgi:hypothetical protein